MVMAAPTAAPTRLQPMELPLGNELQEPRRVRRSRSDIESERALPVLSALVSAPRRIKPGTAWGAAINVARTGSGLTSPGGSGKRSPSLRKDPLAIVSQQRKFREKQGKMESMRDPSFKEIVGKYWSAMTDNGALPNVSFSLYNLVHMRISKTLEPVRKPSASRFRLS